MTNITVAKQWFEENATKEQKLKASRMTDEFTKLVYILCQYKHELEHKETNNDNNID